MIRAIILSMMVSPAFADIWTLYDGDGSTPVGKLDPQAGVTCQYYNAAALLPWKNLGGDWIDAKGTLQGSSPFASVNFTTGIDRLQLVELDVSKLVNADGIVIRREGENPVVKIGSRESTTPPTLSLTLADGSKLTRYPIADASLRFAVKGVCQSVPTGKGPTMSLGHAAVMSFGPLPANIVKAQLKLSIVSSFGPGVLQAFAMVVPRHDATANNNVSSSPGVYYYEPWETQDWWSRTGGTNHPSAQWVQDGGMFDRPSQDGLWWANGESASVPAQGTAGLVQIRRGTGYKGKGLMISYHPTMLAYGVNMGNVILRNVIDDGSKADPDEAWLTYAVKYGKDFTNFTACEGGKAPGLSGSTAVCAGSATPANGYCGWSLRMAYRLICDQQNPAFGRIVLHTYAYDGLMPGWYGRNWYGTEDALLELDKWHCIEQHVKVNTPGIADGINEVYVNGKLTIDRKDVYLRAERPSPEGYGDWRQTTKFPPPAGKRIITDNFGRSFWFNGTTLDTNLGIQKAYMVVHNGGMKAPGKTAQMWIDEIKVSHRRAGCD